LRFTFPRAFDTRLIVAFAGVCPVTAKFLIFSGTTSHLERTTFLGDCFRGSFPTKVRQVAVGSVASTPQEDSKPGRTRREGNITYIQTEFATRVRMAVISLAKREAREAVKRNLRAEGEVKVWLHSASEINTLANAHGPCSGAYC
jgi:hypothetical protein